MKRYRNTTAARDDLKRISRLITLVKESPQGANRLRARFLENFRLLARNSLIGEACPKFGEHMRIWSVGNYVVIYQPQSYGVDIIQVAHGARDLPGIEIPPPAIE
jgi:plasmid stabilization system protein ParE